MHHTLQALAHADRPGDRGALDAQHRFHFVQQVDRVLAFAIELVDEGHDGGVAQAADFHQLDGAFFHALGHVDHHQRRVHRGQHAIGVLAEVGVAGGVEQVDDLVLVRELHHRGGHRDAALFFQRHPVRGGVAGSLASLHRAGHLDRAAEQQQLFGQRGLAGVWMGNNGEGAAARGFVGDFGHEGARPVGRLWKLRKPVIIAASVRRPAVAQGAWLALAARVRARARGSAARLVGRSSGMAARSAAGRHCVAPRNAGAARC